MQLWEIAAAIPILVGLTWFTVFLFRSRRAEPRERSASGESDAPLEALFVQHLDELVRAGKLAEIETMALTSESFPLVAEALRQFGSEDALLRLLARDDRDAKLAAIEGLCYAGTMKAVEPLHALTVGILADAEVRNAAAGAIARIRRPMRGVEPGRVSVASVDEAAGALSFTQTGGLSLTKRDSGP